ncbi:MAG: crossover junction endodeoxyribonuclease RuvC [Candidatus Moranbacteria bacterium RBG_13_45_13]|nr:MAG: crossover junction endodeoxyribonuclease RuvC [Candidatus Moranbacteria bacterium RBG_13_45_13]
MKILGIDPGTATTGWAVVEEVKKNPRLVACGCVNTSKIKSDAERLVEIGKDISSLIKKYKPDEAGIEDIFFFSNQKTAVTVSQARGVVLYELKKNKIPVQNYTPLQVKQALTGYGRADKKQIQLMVKNILRLKSIPKPDDAADAAAIAICHLNSRLFIRAKSLERTEI